jgi:protein TonB
MERPIPTTSHESVAADYPQESIRLHEQGATRLRYLIGTDGNVKDVEILDSSGYPRLDEASVEIVKKKWRFWPALENGKPVEIWMPANIVWKLADKSETKGF